MTEHHHVDDLDADIQLPDKPCCCPPKITLTGSTAQVLTPLSNAMFDDEDIQVRSDANASVNPPGGPQVNADGSGGGHIRTKLRKDTDLVAVEFRRRWEWSVTGDCKVAVRVDVVGDVQAELPCAPEQGSTELTARRVLTVDELNDGVSLGATATVTALDCAGHVTRCELSLFES